MGYGELGQNKEYVLGSIPVIRHNSEPCIVCGHPTGDCATPTSAPHHIWGVTQVPSLEDSTMILVEEDVIQWRQITPFTKSKVVLARKGQQIPVTRARELGIV
jgi:hypothetical protein